jgi:alpha-beta hydrolase superfamily lysophospholipase
MARSTQHALIVLVVGLLSTATAGAADKTPPTPTEACGNSAGVLHARSFWLTTKDGMRLYALEAGAGKTTVVLAHGGRSDLCETIVFASTLLAHGYRVLAFDFRGNGRSSATHSLALGNDLAAAVAHTRKTATEHVFLIGSSMGGAAIVQNTSTLDVDGRISLSGTRLWLGFGINNPSGLAKIRAPYLYVGARDDWRAPLREALAIFRKVGARDKRTAIYPGSEHGWQFVESSWFAPRARALVLAWLASHS